MRKYVIWILIIAFFVGGIGGVVLNRYLLPYLSTFTGFSFLNSVVTSSPIVINRHEEVQLNEGVNLVDLIKQSGNITVSIVDNKNNFLGNGIVATSDGLILTTSQTIQNQIAVSVIANDGTKYAAALKSKDTETNLVMLSITANNLPVAQFDNAANLIAGQRVLFIGRSNVKFEHESLAGFVTQSLANQLQAKQITTDAVVSSDFVGGPIINLNGHVVGLVSAAGQNVISEDIKTFLNNYFSNPK